MAEQEIAVILRLVAKEFQDELKKSQGLLGEFGGFINSWKTQLAAAATTLFAIAKSTADYGDNLLNTSQKIGIGVEALAGLQHGAKLANLEQVQFVQGLKFLSQNIVEAASGMGDGASQFNRMGLSVQTVTGQLKPTEQVLLEVTDKFSSMRDGAAKSELAVKLFGKTGIELIPFLNQGKAGLQGMMEEAKRLGLVMSEQDVKAADEFNDALDRLIGAGRGITLAIGKGLMPVLTQLMELLTTLASGPVKDLGGLISETVQTHLIAVNALLKELAANYQAVKDFFGTSKSSEQIVAELRANVEKAEQEAKLKLFALKHPEAFALTQPLPDRKSAAPLPTDDAGRVKALEARKKARAQAVKEEIEILKTGFRTQEILAEQDALVLNLGETSRIALKHDLKRKELEELGVFLLKEKEIEVAWFAERTRLGFKNAEEQRTIKTEHAAALHKIDSEIRKNQVEGDQAFHQAELERMRLTISDQVALGQALMQLVSDQYKEQDRVRQRDLDAEIDYRKGLLAQAQTDLATGSVLAARRGAILDAELAKAVGLSKEHLGAIAEFTHVTYVDSVDDITAKLKELVPAMALTEQQLTAIVTTHAAQREHERRRERDSFLSGWAEGLHKYVTDTESMFSVAVDLARQTAQVMNQAFQRFFLDVFEGRVRTLKDVLRGLLDFARQIISQVAATLATSGILKIVLAAFGATPVTPIDNVPHARGGLVQRFAVGGPVIPFSNGDSVRALLTPGEYVMSRAAVERMGVGALDRVNHGGGASASGPTVVQPAPVEIAVSVVNQSRQDVSAQHSTAPDGEHFIKIFVREMKTAFREGAFDSEMQRFGNNVQPVRR